MTRLERFGYNFQKVTLWSIILAFALLKILPITWFCDYKEIENLSNINTIGYNIPMRTYIYPRVTIDAEYNDILRCQKEASLEGSKVVWKERGSQSTKHRTIIAADGPYWGDWDFKAESYGLREEDKCMIESNTVLYLWFGVRRSLDPHYTEPFHMVKRVNSNEKEEL